MRNFRYMLIIVDWFAFVCVVVANAFKDNSCDAPVLLVANKIDQYGDRMVSLEEGQRRYREIDCIGFREISVRESIEQVNIG